MTYQQCLDYFYSQLPMFHRVGAAALKPDLTNTRLLCGKLGDPQTKFPAIHIAGTNGKGSCSHMLAAVLQSAGYKTGLYTSPHIKDFRERIKINGRSITEQEVVSFVKDHQNLLDRVRPSFFELTVALAFLHFARHRVDIAIIEVGLGGRLDSTNIIVPLVSVITNIGFDHSYLLGDTLGLIAREKAGIIKPGVPVVIGERHPEVDQVFIQKAQQCNSIIHFAQDIYQVSVQSRTPLVVDIHKNHRLAWETLPLQLGGPYQPKNIPPVLKVLDIVAEMDFPVEPGHIRSGLEQIIDLTGIQGRWQILGDSPTVVCDTGHNQPAMEYIVAELQRINRGQLHMVLGFVNDKDIGSMLKLLPKKAQYYFCAADVPRSLDAFALCELAGRYHLKGKVVPDTNEALKIARSAAGVNDLIFVGGSTFVVAELTELD